MFSNVSAFDNESKDTNARDQTGSSMIHPSRRREFENRGDRNSQSYPNERSYGDAPYRSRNQLAGGGGRHPRDRDQGFGRGGRTMSGTSQPRRGLNPQVSSIGSRPQSRPGHFAPKAKTDTNQSQTIDRNTVLPTRTRLYVIVGEDSPATSTIDVDSDDIPSYIETYLFPDVTCAELHNILKDSFPELDSFGGRVIVFNVRKKSDDSTKRSVEAHPVITYQYPQVQSESKQLKRGRDLAIGSGDLLFWMTEQKASAVDDEATPRSIDTMTI